MIIDTAAAFVEQRAKARPLAEFPGEVPADLAAAYAVQERAIGMARRPIGGWKVAMIRPEWRDRYAAERLAGPIIADAIHRVPDGGSAEVAVFAGGFAALEAEFVVVVGRDLAPDVPPSGDDELAAVVRSLHVGVEVASSPFKGINDFGPGSVIADHGNNAGAILGPAIHDWRTRAWEALPSRILVGGRVVGEGSAAKVPGGPLAAFAFLLGHLAQRGRGLKAGDVVLTGMTTGIHEVEPGDVARAEFDGVGSFDITIAAARADGLAA